MTEYYNSASMKTVDQHTEVCIFHAQPVNSE